MRQYDLGVLGYAHLFGAELVDNNSILWKGRMPFAELADSIVQSGRETLQNAIKMVEENPRWNAKVKYGDTDSMFVLLEGRTMQQAFTIGKVSWSSIIVRWLIGIYFFIIAMHSSLLSVLFPSFESQ